MERDIFQLFEKGTLVSAGQRQEIAACPWNAHKDFSGIFLENTIKSSRLNQNSYKPPRHCAIYNY